MTDHRILIIGQGLAGTLLAIELIDRGLSIKILDDNHATSASLVGTAVINPVTGRRYAKSWNIDELLPLAKETYLGIGGRLGNSYLSSTVIMQVLADKRVEEIWMTRVADPEFRRYLNTDIFILRSNGLNELRCAKILNALHLDVTRLIRDACDRFKTDGLLEQQVLDMSQITITSDHIEFHGMKFGHVVFCEGARVTSNPLFDWLELLPMKGEYLVCRIPDLELNQHLKSNISIIPIEKDLFWCGSTYDRYNEDPDPTSFGRNEILRKLGQIVTAEIHVEHHGTGIRATTHDRRPYVGSHPDHPNVHVITGLGTKGASLAPYCARAMADHLLAGIAIPGEIDVLRI